MDKFMTTFQNNFFVKIGVMIFSIAALGAVAYMLYRRLLDLNYKTAIVFKYLACLEAVKFMKETATFDKTFQQIEGYLNDIPYWTG
jgi:hypothetical protein